MHLVALKALNKLIALLLVIVLHLADAVRTNHFQCYFAGPAAEQYFSLLQEQLADTAVAMHLVAHNVLDSLMQQIKLHVNGLVTLEYGCSLKLLQSQQQPVQQSASGVDNRCDNS